MKIVIQGAGEVGSHLAKMLSLEANDITVIDDDPQRLANISSIADVIAIEGAPSSLRVMREADVQDADLFISVVPFVPQDVNIVSALLAKNLGAKKVTARIDDNDFLSAENKLLFKQMGIELMFYPERLAADEIFDLLKHSSSTESMDFARGKLQVEVFKLEEDSPLLDMKLAEFAAIATSDELQFRVIAISRGGKTIMPKYDTKFMFNDLVFIIATREGMAFLMKFLGKSNIEIDKVMILGGSDIAELVAARLSQKISSVKILERDKERGMILSERLPDNVIIVIGDGRNSDLLLEEGIKDYDAFLALTGNDEANVLACVVAKKFGVDRTIAEVENIDYIPMAEALDIGTVLNKKTITASYIYQMLLDASVLNIHNLTSADAEIVVFIAKEGSRITRGKVRDMELPEDTNIGAIVRAGEGVLVNGETRIIANDQVVVFCKKHVLRRLEHFFK